MKTLLATAALAALITTGLPASAQILGDRWDESAGAAFAQSPIVRQQRAPTLDQRARRAHSDNPNNDVYDNQGTYIGSDPDVQIRNDLRRDPPGRGD